MKKIWYIMTIAAALVSLQAAEPALRIGWGRRSINPGKPVAITGQHYLRVSIGEYNPVVTEALVIENGRDAAIFVSVDVVSVRVLDEVCAKLRAEAPEIPAEKLVVNATHSHTGPSFSNGKPLIPGMTYMPTDESIDFLAARISEAVIEAWKNRAPGSVAFGYGFATVGHSRRTAFSKPQAYPDKGKRSAGTFTNGYVRMYGNTAEDTFSHYEAGTDAFANFMYTFDAAGKLTGAVINVPCPAQTNEAAWVLHASFWHPVREKLRARYGNIGIIAQSAAAGDLAPRQLHYLSAELRRYRLKYPERYRELMKTGLPCPRGLFKDADAEKLGREKDALEMLRAEDISSRITAAFDEVLSWARNDRLSTPVFRHEVASVKLEKRMVTEEELRDARKVIEGFDAEIAELKKAGKPVHPNLISRKARFKRVIDRYELQKREPRFVTDIHAIRIGDFAFVSNRFELFIDFMHRIQGRSPFVQTIVVQLTADRGQKGGGSYLPTERAVFNQGYSATLQSNLVSPAGGQQLVDYTIDLLKRLHSAAK
ncbi:MAG: hypothetical protein IJH79_17025 [Lentisphaeria bacterium]|nr:hypothetical protein [Lentisphaeria bacterium]